MSWRKLPVSLKELCIDTTLRCGQSFRWKKLADGSYNCALNGRLLSLRQDPTHLHYCAIYPSSSKNKKDKKKVSVPLTPDTDGGGGGGSRSGIAAVESADADLKEEDEAEDGDDDDTKAFLRHYLNLGPNLSALYEQWSSTDANFKKKAPRFTGVRILRQDAWEALVGFICSSNNNIPRISQMMDKLCIHYGSLIGHIDAQAFYDMPPPDALTGPDVEAHLRQLGFGYRAKYIYKTAVMITEEKKGWLDSLRNPESPLLGQKSRDAGDLEEGGREGYRHAHEQLLALQGVGPKVADCVCLMGLGWGEAVPVDTHVWNIACRDYGFGRGKHSSLNKHVYGAIGDRFRNLWGKEAGWAHSVLFTADLRAFSERLIAEVEVRENLVKDEGEEIVEREAVLKVELAPAIAVGDGEPEEKPIVKVERRLERVNGHRGQRDIKVESPDLKEEDSAELAELVELKREAIRASIKPEQSDVKHEDTEMQSIEHEDAAVKKEAGPEKPLLKREAKTESQAPIKQERSTSKQTPVIGNRRLPSRAIKDESHTPTKHGIKARQHGASNGVPEGRLSREEQAGPSMKDEDTVKAEAQDMVDTEILPNLGMKREAEQEEQKPSTSENALPQRRKSKRQRRG